MMGLNREFGIELLKQNPQNSNATLLEIQTETGEKISSDILKRVAKKHGLVWKRMRKSLRVKRDQEIFAA